MGASRLALLLLAYGGPQRLDEVGEFLTRVMGEGRVTPEIVERACCRYRAIGGGSPLVANTLTQAGALEARLQGGRGGAPESSGSPAEFGGVAADQIKVFVGMRHSPPFISAALAEALDFGQGKVLAVIMASHQSPTATGGYLTELEEALQERDLEEAPPAEVVLLPPWHTHPGYLDAVAARAGAALDELVLTGAAEPARTGEGMSQPLLLFSAHSLPLAASQQGEPEYEDALVETIEGVVARLGDVPWRLGYQSRSRRPGLRWLGPDAAQVIQEEAAAGRRAIAVVPLGFVVEHLETLYDLDVELRSVAEGAGLRWSRALTVQDHSLFIEALTAAVESEMARTP